MKGDVRIALARLDERQKAERSARKTSDRAEERERRAEIGALRDAVSAAKEAVEKGRLTYEEKQKEYDDHHNGLIEKQQITLGGLVTLEKFEGLEARLSILESASLAGGGQAKGIRVTLSTALVVATFALLLGGFIVSLLKP